MPTEIPLVTAIMPTRGRAGWAADAVRMFREQTYPRKEMVIIDDMQERSFDAAPDGVVYERAPRVPIGSKRNLACSRSSGDIICHWDSDDKYQPNRIEEQVQQLIESGKDMVGYHTMPFEEADGPMRRFMYTSSGKFLIGVSMMFWRDSWQNMPFTSENEGEDSSFMLHRSWESFDGSNGLIVARVHVGNTSNKRIYINNPEHANQWRPML